MEHLQIALDSERFDKAVHGGLDCYRVLPEYGDLAIYVKPGATLRGRPMAVFTFTVQLPDGTRFRAQAVTTLTNLKNALHAIQGWESGGHLEGNRN